MFFGCRIPPIPVIGAKGSEDSSVCVFDGHAPRAGESERGREVTKFSPFVVGKEITREHDGARGGGGRTGAEIGIWFEAIDGGEVVSGKVRGGAVAKETFLVENQNRNDGAGTSQMLASGGKADQDFAASGAVVEHGVDVFDRLRDEIVINGRRWEARSGLRSCHRVFSGI